MPGISAKLPLSVSQKDGPYRLTKTVTEALTQDFKMLLLTNPGERMMDPDFGIGIRNYLFENASEFIYDELTSLIIDATASYLPQIQIEKVLFNESSDDNQLNDLIDSNIISITIRFSINPFSNQETLTIPII
jgi:phage baseplate assembly protein W